MAGPDGERLARTFDAIGDEIGGARYPAIAFVQWLADEYADRPVGTLSARLHATHTSS